MYDNYYDILNVEQFSSIEDIRKKFKTLMKTFHPDKCQGESITFLKIKMAYDLLTDSKYKENYDRNLRYTIEMNERAEEVEAVQDEDNPCQEHYVCLQCMGVNYLERKTSRDDKTRSAICEYCSKFYKLI